MSSNHQITTITFLKFGSVAKRWWAMRQMRYAHASLISVPGLVFYRLLGSGGGNGFSILPDLSTYSLLAVWKDKSSADSFFQNHSYSHRVFEKAQYSWTVFLETIKVRGTWEYDQPFPVSKANPTSGSIAVLTRASIHPAKLWSFWRNVPKVSNRLEQHQEGLLFSKGIGEVPLLQQATFSVWKNYDAMVAYAYHNAKHREMIKKTRTLGWYREELFAEFSPIGVRGNWPTIPNLSPYLKSQLSA